MVPGRAAILEAPDKPPPVMPSRRGRVRVTPNLFGIPFGLAGLAGAWAAGARFVDLAAWSSDAIWVLAAAAWALVGTAYVVNARSRLAAELADPVFAPFLSLAVITPMLLGVALSEHAHGPGQVVALVSLALTILLGAWLTGSWIIDDIPLARWHPGYFLPTVAGGLLSSSVAAELGHRDLAELLFGYGAVCWLILGSILLARLFTQPALPTPLLPTIAIEVAPPVVAGNAWFLLNGGRVDAVALGLAGYATLMVLVQLRLLPLYRTVPFGPAFWAFSFSYAAVFTVGIRWLAVEQTSHARTWTVTSLAVLTLGFAALMTRTLGALAKGTFLPRPTPPARLPRSVTHDDDARELDA